jgi:hypothetical protein
MHRPIPIPRDVTYRLLMTVEERSQLESLAALEGVSAAESVRRAIQARRALIMGPRPAVVSRSTTPRVRA